jgi:gluconolactonase
MNDYYDVISFKRFRPYIIGHAKMEVLHTGMRWGEGPVWFADAQFLLFVDIPAACQLPPRRSSVRAENS